MKILAIGAHFDDIELGCGGAMLRWKDEGNDLAIYVATHSGYEDPMGKPIRSKDDALAEGLSVAEELGAKLYRGNFETLRLNSDEQLHVDLLRVIADFSPDLVLVHWFGDTHHDHRELSYAVLHVSRKIPKLLFYRSNWYKSEIPFDANYFVNISEYLDKKIDLVRKHKSEFERAGDVWERFMQSHADMQGIIANCTYAEAFQLVKWID